MLSSFDSFAKRDRVLFTASIATLSVYFSYRLFKALFKKDRTADFYTPFGLLTSEYGEVDTPGLPIGHKGLGLPGGSYWRDDEKRLATFPPPFPDGWYRICNVDDIPAARRSSSSSSDDHAAGKRSKLCTKPLSVSALGSQFVVFRKGINPTQEIGVLDAYCPHLGAHLGGGEVTEDGCLKCPFHAWKFDTGGQCVDIEWMPPLKSGRRPLPKGQLARSYATRVIAGMVFIWFSETNEPVGWEIQFNFRKYETSGSLSPFNMISTHHNCAAQPGISRDDPADFTFDTTAGAGSSANSDTETSTGAGGGSSSRSASSAATTMTTGTSTAEQSSRMTSPTDGAGRTITFTPSSPRATASSSSKPHRLPPIHVETFTDGSLIPPNGKDELVSQISGVRKRSLADPVFEARLRDELYRTVVSGREYQQNVDVLLKENQIKLIRTTSAVFAMHLIEPSLNSADFFHFTTMHEALALPVVGPLITSNYYVIPEYFAPFRHLTRFDSVGVSTVFKLPEFLANNWLSRLLGVKPEYDLV